MAGVVADSTLVYHEKQVAALCGVHAINNLLQGAYCNEIELAEIAAELDAAERELMLADGSDTPDALRFLAEDSGNVDASGNFSVSVLKEYLAKRHGVTLEMDPSLVDRALTDPNEFSAYMLNLEHHWFALRRMPCAGGEQRWLNLNSMLKGGPEVISDFYLSAFLNSMRSQHYTIMPVAGAPLPAPFTGGLGGVAGDSMHTMGDIAAAGKAAAGGGGSAAAAAAARRAAAQRARQAAAADPAMEAALRASLADADFGSYDEYVASTGGPGAAGMGGAAGGAGMSEDDLIAAAIAASLASPKGHPAGAGAPAEGFGSSSGSGSGSGSAAARAPSSSGGVVVLDHDDDEDEEARVLAAAIAMSMDGEGGAGGAGTGGVPSTAAAAVAPAAVPAGPSRHYAAVSSASLRSALPAEPEAASSAAGGAGGGAGSAASAPAVRIQLRLPAADAAAQIHAAGSAGASAGSAAAAAPAPSQLQRRFSPADPALALFDWAAACWLDAARPSAAAATAASPQVHSLPDFALVAGAPPPRAFTLAQAAGKEPLPAAAAAAAAAAADASAGAGIAAGPVTIGQLLGSATSAALIVRPIA